MNTPFETARRHFTDGNADFEAGRFESAEQHYETSLALLPGRASTLVNLAVVRIRLRRPESALALLDQALAAAPDDAGAWFQRATTLALLDRHADALVALDRLLAIAPGTAQAWMLHGQTLLRLDRHAQALASYDRALEIDPGLAAAATDRGNLLKELGRTDEAKAAFRQAIGSGADPVLNAYYLAALTGDGAPDASPRSYVEALFDDYAASFDTHLVGTLGYRAHRILIDHLEGIGPKHFRSALDLGCGTGLCGPLVKPNAGRIDGIDVSAQMLEHARSLGVYDRLEQADLADHLERTERRHDLVVAADVFIYVGALEAVFAGVARVLEPGGVFCFSVEHAQDAVDYELRPSLRYAHSQRYLRELAARCGFEVALMHPQPIREDQRRPIAGLYVYLRRP